jgi:hypothetical protein
MKKCDKFGGVNGITLIALVVSVIVLLILARDKYKYNYRRRPEF